MKTIDSREDVSLLVNSFYSKIRLNEILGPIFNGHIPDHKWPEHLSKLTDFWESNLFGVAKFRGNPTHKHVQVDRNLGHKIEQLHFDQWLKLWYETVDELYEGDRAIKAKDAAQNMAFAQFKMIKFHRG